MKYHVQLKRIEFVQVEIESDELIALSEVESLAAEKAQREFGCADETEVIHIERFPRLVFTAAQQSAQPDASPTERIQSEHSDGSRG